MKRVVLITGASRGIGQAIAKRFAKENVEIIITARNIAGLEKTDDIIRSFGKTATIIPLDLKEIDKINILGEAIYKKFGRLDILIGNAGYLGGLAPIVHSDERIFNDAMAINLTANYHLLRTCHPLLKISKAGRAIFTTSSIAQNPTPFWGGYAASKIALEMLIKTYAIENSKTNVKANLVNPHRTNTDMREIAFPKEDKAKLAHPDIVAEIFVKLADTELQETGKIFDA